MQDGRPHRSGATNGVTSVRRRDVWGRDVSIVGPRTQQSLAQEPSAAARPPARAPRARPRPKGRATRAGPSNLSCAHTTYVTTLEPFAIRAPTNPRRLFASTFGARPRRSGASAQPGEWYGSHGRHHELEGAPWERQVRDRAGPGGSPWTGLGGPRARINAPVYGGGGGKNRDRSHGQARAVRPRLRPGTVFPRRMILISAAPLRRAGSRPVWRRARRRRSARAARAAAARLARGAPAEPSGARQSAAGACCACGVVQGHARPRRPPSWGHRDDGSTAGEVVPCPHAR
jgi:hypothetical protein